MAAKAQRVFVTVDPLDVLIRVKVLAEKYGEPENSMHEIAKALGLTLRWRGGIAYVNEREYQDALGALPTEKPKKDEKVGKPKNGRGGDSGDHRHREEAVPGDRGRRPRVGPQLRIEEGGV